MTQVRVRFAPSPTGELHVGGARTALFNWLFARKHDGIFVLRIEDTDAARSSDEMTRQILEGMKWLGLNWDEGPFYQSVGKEEHLAYAQKCVESGAAYYDFSDPEELAEERKAAQKEGKPFRYDRRGMEPDPERALQRIDGGEKAALRFKVPEGETVYNDIVHGEVRFRNDKVDDFVLLRNDGSPTYMLSVVADDLKMAITHVIRGDDHIANTPKQILLYTALGHNTPQFAHLPLILGKDKKKLSKRHGGNTMKDYMSEGFLPEAVFNFLALLGWNPGSDQEIFSPKELIEVFSFDGVGKSAAVFDTDKLEWINSQWINRMGTDSLVPFVQSELTRLDLWDDNLLSERRPWFDRVINLLKERSRRTWDIARDGVFFFADPSEYNPKAVKKFCKGSEVPGNILKLTDELDTVQAWTAESIESHLREVAEKLELSAAKLIHPLRIGITGLGVTPDIFTIAELLGKNCCLQRLKAFEQFLDSQQTKPE